LDGGIITSDRSYGITIKNGKVVNESTYGKIGGLVRGKGRNMQLDNITMVGDVVALFNGDIRQFGSAATGAIPAEYIARNIRHFGSADYAVKVMQQQLDIWLIVY
jgi:putative transposon-encoded protein